MNIALNATTRGLGRKSDMEGLKYDHVDNDAEVWEKIVRKVRAGMMPPKGELRPDRSVMDGFCSAG